MLFFSIAPGKKYRMVVQMKRPVSVSPKPKNRWKRVKRNYELYLFLIPAMLFFILFCYVPIYGVQIAFRDYKAGMSFTQAPWVGFKYFQMFLFENPLALRTIVNTLLISVYQIILSFPIPILFALMLNQLQKKGFKRFTQMVSYAPYFISTVVAVGLLNAFFAQGTGIFNIIRELLGLEKLPFMTDASWFRTIYIGSNIWQSVGWNSIIYIAALAGIDQEVYEAAMIDGASRFQRILRIELPALLPTIIILLIMNVGSLMGVGFEKIFLMQTNTNLSVSEVISTYTYKIGLLNANYSYSAAIGLFNSVVNFMLLAAVNFIAKKTAEISIW